MTQGRTPDRFVVRSVTGYSLETGAKSQPQTSFWVLDLDYAQVVATFYSARGEHGPSAEPARKRAAQARCRYLNEQYRRWLHSGRWSVDEPEP